MGTDPLGESPRAEPSRPRGAHMRVLVLLAPLLLWGCERTVAVPDTQRVVGGDPRRGHAVIVRVSCGVCHVIPGVKGAQGIVGPSLEQFGQRNLIAGVVPNRPEQLAVWVRDAPSIAPETGMPELPMTEAESRDVAAYLYTLR